MLTIEDTWVIIPLYNEEEVIQEVVAQVRSIFPRVVCIDDGSKDASARLAEAAGAIVIHHPINLGQGAALQTGFEFFLSQTDGRFLATFDADGQHRCEDIVSMRDKALAEDLAVVLGSRFLTGAPQEMSVLRRCVLKLATVFTRKRTGAKLTDAHNGLRLLRRDAVEAIELKHNRMAHASEIVEQLIDTGMRWAEAPVRVRYTDYSRSKGQSSLNSVNILVELLLG